MRLPRNYRKAHGCLVRHFGKAAEYDCVDCGGQARDWSQTHDTNGFDSDHYNPRCRSCHVKYDMPYTRRAEPRYPTAATRDKMSQTMRDRCKDPGVREMKSRVARKLWQDPEFRQKMDAARRRLLSPEDWRVIENTLGLPQAETAAMLGLSVKQVENARSRLRRRKKAA